MTEHHKRNANGQLIDDVDTFFTGRDSLATYDLARDALGRFRVPTLLHRNAVNERLFVANFDGTGNDAGGDPEHMTNVARFAADLSEHVDPRVASGYLRGPGTHPLGVIRAPDGAWGISHDARVREMYRVFALQVQDRLRDNPDADIRLVSVGFSRGAEEAAALARMVHERGIEVPNGNGMRQLVAPGKIPQAVGLFDPVGSGHPRAHDRQLPSSVVSGYQVVARDEKRSQFPSTMIIRQGHSSDGRFLGVTVAGAHSDIGGSYHLDGLAVANRALMADYMNSLSEGDLVRRPDLYSSIADYDTHRSQDHEIFYTTGAFRRLGERDTRGAQHHPPHCRPVDVCAPPDPIDPSLEERLGQRHFVVVGETPLDRIGPDLVIDRDHLRGDERALPRQEPNVELAHDDDTASRNIASGEPLVGDHGPLAPNNAEERDNHIAFSRFPRLEATPPAQRDEIRFESATHQGSVRGVSAEIDHSPTSPAHPTHRDHRLYNSIHDQLTTVHKEEGITLNPQQLDRLAHCSVATAKQCGMSDVSHLSLGQDKQGNLLPEVHLYQAFRGDVDDPRTKWGKLDALEAFQTPVETASRDLQVANQQMDQVQQDQQMRMAQQQEQGMSMSR